MGNMLCAQNNQLSLDLEDINIEVIEVYKKKLQDAKNRIPRI